MCARKKKSVVRESGEFTLSLLGRFLPDTYFHTGALTVVCVHILDMSHISESQVNSGHLCAYLYSSPSLILLYTVCVQLNS